MYNVILKTSYAKDISFENVLRIGRLKHIIAKKGLPYNDLSCEDKNTMNGSKQKLCLYMSKNIPNIQKKDDYFDDFNKNY